MVSDELKKIIDDYGHNAAWVNSIGNIQLRNPFNEDYFEVEVTNLLNDKINKYNIENITEIECYALFENIIAIKEDYSNICKKYNLNYTFPEHKPLQILELLKFHFVKKENSYKTEFERNLLYNIKDYTRIDVCTVSPEAAVLISNARIGSEKIEMKPIYFNSVNYLFGTCTELLFTLDKIYAVQKFANNLSLVITITFDGEFSEHDKKNVEPYINFVKNYFSILKCEKSPIVNQEPQKRKSLRDIKQIGGIFRRNIFLTKEYKYRKINYKEKNKLDKTGKEIVLVSISGYVRNQPYGPGRQKYKTIWIDGFIRGQWVKSGLNMITINK